MKIELLIQGVQFYLRHLILTARYRNINLYTGNRFLLSPVSVPIFVCLLHRTHIAVVFKSWLDDVGRLEKETAKLNPMRMMIKKTTIDL